MKNSINWFEIAVTDLDRATKFYETTLGIKLKREVFFGSQMSIFPSEQPGVGGTLLKDPKRPAGGSGSVVFLDAHGQLDACLERARKAGAEVVTPKTAIGEFGAYALLRDSENNLVGLHSPT